MWGEDSDIYSQGEGQLGQSGFGESGSPLEDPFAFGPVAVSDKPPSDGDGGVSLSRPVSPPEGGLGSVSPSRPVSPPEGGVGNVSSSRSVSPPEGGLGSVSRSRPLSPPEGDWDDFSREPLEPLDPFDQFGGTELDDAMRGSGFVTDCSLLWPWDGLLPAAAPDYAAPDYAAPDDNAPAYTAPACAAPLADDGQKKVQEKKKGDYLYANYPYRTSPGYQALIAVGKSYREARLRNDEITKLMRAFRKVHAPHDQELGRAVRYLGAVAHWLDAHWEVIGGKFVEFAHAWCRREWGFEK